VTGLVAGTALVTGAAQGIGRAIAEALVEAGALVIAADIAPQTPLAGARTLTLDVTDEAGLAALIAAEDPPIGILVNNAAIYRERPGLDFPTEEWDRMFAIVARSTFVATREVSRRLRERRLPGAIINISSVAGKFAFPTQADYCAAKAAVLGFTRGAALDLARHDITVNAICPGTVDTPMIANVIGDLARAGGITEAEQRERLMAGIPIGRMQRPDEIAAGVVFLASMGARAITGESLTIDGGLARD
jgi:NAD(P)-dependent dehydrogenase (short-subunit alcohol dehydrogenase family)